MYIKYTDIGNSVVIYMPETVTWTIKVSTVSPNGFEECGLVLEYENKQIYLRDGDDLISGRPNLKYDIVCDFYNIVVNEIFQIIKDFPKLRTLDIDEIEVFQLRKYEKLWAEKGYITIDENGCW